MNLDFFISIIERSAVLGYGVIFLIFLLESLAFIGLLIPGTVFLVISGFLAARGALDMPPLFFVIFLGIIIGDVVSFSFGKKGFSRFSFIRREVYEKILKKGEDFFNKHGNKSVIFGRFIGPIRPLVSYTAGLFRFSNRKFYIYNFLGAVLWVAAYFILGYFFGQALGLVEVWSTRVGMLLVILVVFFVLIHLLKRFVIKQGEVIFSVLDSFFQIASQRILKNKTISKIIKKYPRFFVFIKNRFRKHNFYGQPLTFLTFAFLYVIILFAGVVEDVLTSSAIVDVDTRIHNLLYLYREENLATVFLWITMLGKWPVIIVFSLLLSFSLWFWRKRFFIISLWITVAGSAFFGAISKLVFKRTRPDGGIYIEDSFSFPSGHSTMAMAFYGFVIYFFLRTSKNLTTKANALFIYLSIIFLVVFSRLYLGVHYFSDVWAGVLLGLLWVIIGISFGEWLFFVFGKGPRSEIAKKDKYLALILLVMFIPSYIILSLQFWPKGEKNIYRDFQIINKVEPPVDIFFNDKLPSNAETLFGREAEPINFIIIAKDFSRLKDVFNEAGWNLADNLDFYSLSKMGSKKFFNQQYSEEPIAPLFWDMRVNDYGFEKRAEYGINNNYFRHQIRIWKTSYEISNGHAVFVGAASLGGSRGWRMQRRVDADLDKEREFLVTDVFGGKDESFNFSKTRISEETEKKKDDELNYFTDGEAYVVYIKKD